MKRGDLFCLLLLQISAILFKRSFLGLALGMVIPTIVFLILKKKRGLFLIAGFFFCFFLIYTPSIPVDNHESEESILVQAKIFQKGNGYYLVQDKQAKYLLYAEEEWELGDYLLIEGILKNVRSYSIPNNFSFSEYLKNFQVYHMIQVSNCTLLSSWNLRTEVKQWAMSGLSGISKQFIQMMVFADKSANIDLYQDLTSISIIQLFVISGFHIQLLYLILKKWLVKNALVCFFIIGFYLYILGFPVSALRAFIWLFLQVMIHERKWVRLNRSQQFGAMIILLLLIEPLFLFRLSFQLSVSASFAMLLVPKRKKNFLSPFVFSLQIYLCLLPLLINMQHEINVFSFIYNAILALPVSLLYLGGWITAFTKITDLLYMGMITTFESMIELLKVINIAIITPQITIIRGMIYYIFLLILFYLQNLGSKKQILLFSNCMLFYIGYLIYANDIYSPASVTFLDVGQGDATIFKGKNNQFCVLVDTGGSLFNDISETRVIPYLKSLGIRKLDMVILTHDDYDHRGAFPSLQAHFPISEVIKEPFSHRNLSGLSIRNINHYASNETDDNAKSLVLLFQYQTRSYLIMGDAPIEIEEQIIRNEALPSIDVLRLGHHGSKTSTSEIFLRIVQPKLAIISVGYENRYHHPHSEVLTLLQQKRISYFRTDLHGTIVVKEKINYRYMIKKLWHLVYNIIVKKE